MKTTFTRLFLCLALVAFCHYGHAANYYFSTASGNDSRSAAQAQNPLTPWKTIDKLNSIFYTLKPGDQILFKRGETFYGSIYITKSGASGSPIKFGAYGSGAKPVITSLLGLNTWTSVGNGVYSSHSSSLPADQVNVLLLNNVNQEMGRYPNSDGTNKGYLNVDSHSGNSSITGKSLPSSPSWTGAEVVIRKTYWIIDRHKITSHSGSTLSYAPTAGSNYSPRDNFGYFVQNHIKTLDKLGEWYYDAKNRKMNVYFGSKSPSSYNVQVVSKDYLVANSNFLIKYVTFDNLHFKGANRDIFHLKGGTDVLIQNCEIEHAGENGLSVEGTSNLSIQNNKILSSNNNGMYLRTAVRATIKNNLVKDTGLLPGLGKSGDSNGVAIFAPSDNNLIEYNEVLNTGYLGIRFGGNSTTVKNNLVNYFCMTKNDGAGIYVYTGKSNQTYTNRKVIGNIVLNGIGVREGTNISSVLAKPQSEGIYLDDNTTGVEVANNTVANITSKGIYLHNARENRITDNLVYNSNNQMVLVNDNLGEDIRSNVITGNIFFSKSAEQNNLNISSIKNDIAQMGTFDKNIYASPLSDNYRITNRYNMRTSYEVNKTYDLAGWQKGLGKDLNSGLHPVDIPAYEVEEFIGGNKYDNESFERHANYVACNDCISSWVSDIKLDAGAIKIKGSGSFEATFNVGDVAKDKTYVLRFSGVANKSFAGKSYLRHRGSPWQTVSAVNNVEFSQERGEYEVVFKSASTLSGTSVIIRFENITGAELSLDNFKFHEAKVAYTDPDQKIKFEYNPTTSEKSIALDGEYVDMKNVSYSGSIRLAPYSSIILIRTGNRAAPVIEDNKLEIGVFAPIFLNTGSGANTTQEGKPFVGDQGHSSYYGASSTYSNKGASTDVLFQTERFAKSLKFSIPVPNGTYRVKTYHNELYYGKKGPSARAGRRVFDLSLEGKLVKDNLDLYLENGNKETVLVFEKVEVRDGVLNLDLVASVENASVSGISIEKASVLDISVELPSVVHSLYLNTGSSAGTVLDGHTFEGDANNSSYYNSGSTYSYRGASTDVLFQSERFGKNLKYAIPVPNGTYTVKTYHNELYFGKTGPSAGPGKRVFDLSLEGRLVKDNFDIYLENANKPTILIFKNVEVRDGLLNLDMVSSADNASISGISLVATGTEASRIDQKISLSEESMGLEEKETVQESSVEKIQLYPNPARTETTLAAQVEIQHILIHDMNGQLIRQFDPQMLRSDRGKYTIPLANVPQGLYLVSLVGQKGMIDQLRLIVRP